MTKQVQRRRGTATQHTSFTGAEGELSVNTTNKSVHVHDGATAGGIELARKDGSNVAFTSGTLDGVTIGGTTAGAGTFTNLTATGTTTLAGASTSADITFGDNDKAIFGAGSDLQIYHDGSHSYISDQGTGRLKIFATDLEINNAGNTANYIQAFDGGAVQLFYNNSSKLATTSTGVDISGTLTSDGLTVDGTFNFTSAVNGIINNPASFFINIDSDNNNAGEAFYISRDAENTAGARVAKFDATGDISFYEDTGTTAKFFWDASAEQLSITSNVSASYPLALLSNQLTAGGEVGIRFGYDGLGYQKGAVLFEGVDAFARGNMHFCLDGNGNSDSADVNDAKMTITYDGNVGIGTVPSAWNTFTASLQIDGASLSGLGANNTALASNAYYDSAWKYYGTGSASLYQQNAGLHRWDIAGSGTAGTAISFSEAMRIDSSGNLLVGKTTTSNLLTTAGHVFYGNGEAFLTRAGTPLFLGRTGSDGSIVNFYKDGTAVGSIGTFSSDLYIGTNDSGLRFEYAGLNAIVPFDVNSSATSDAATDLGNGSARFKDLYLSGGVVFGATGGSVTSKTLDDYEEGTWTPTFGSLSGTPPSPSYAIQVGTYVKVGKLVFISARIDLVSSSGGTDRLTILGLPFTVSNTTSYVPAAYIGYKASWATTGPDYGRFSTNQTRIELYADGNTGDTNITPANLTSGTSVIVGGFYEIA